jgi:hypothetical protein
MPANDPQWSAAGAARYVFVGHSRSHRAIRMGVYWEDGRLAGKTLHDAPRAIGLDPQEQTYLNLYRDDDPQVIDQAALARLRALADAGAVIVGLGKVVHAALARAGVAHLPLVHPAARGAIRARDAYQDHVASALIAAGVTDPGSWVV